MLYLGEPGSLSMSLFYGLGCGVGFALALLVHATLEERIAEAPIPRPFRGLPLSLITLGILAMAFLGFTGVVPA